MNQQQLIAAILTTIPGDRDPQEIVAATLDYANQLRPCNGDGDYELQGSGCWIDIDTLTIHIYRRFDGEAVTLEIFPNPIPEESDPLMVLNVPFNLTGEATVLQMLRGRPTTVYLSDLMQRVGAIDATYRSETDGTTTVDFTLSDGRRKQQTLPRTAKLIDDKKGTEHANQV